MKRILLFLMVLLILFIVIDQSPIKEGSIKPRHMTEIDAALQTEGDINKFNQVEDSCVSDEEVLTGSKSDWVLLWSDEFNSDCLDMEKWNMEDWAALKNNELQYYSPNNVQVEDGVLKLVSRKEQYRGKSYTSGAIHTKDKFEFSHGKVEMRAKLPAGQGLFPAFWMMTNKEKTWLPEIDIMEMLGHKTNEIWMVVHWLNEEGELTSDSSSFTGPDYSKDFHTFSIEWTSGSITWFIDGIARYSTDAYVPRENMYLYLNTAIGGNWPGSPDQTTEFPAVFEIDYVRVYKNRGE
ncbi:family 16 glycosylhydrolase [Chungangia koreensis]|uniref:licheninase n=1 Tax=Chungangia koreensis TaxID=752657 RepID=A0ABV8X3S6_9LACT